MASSPNSCGVDNSYVFPSDPNNAGTISATAGIGAINVSWTYPTVNPHAVAFVVVRRSTSANANSHTPIATTKGNSFSDPMSESQAGTRYYYWIQVFSVNGTAADYVGPANAVAGSHSQSILDLISGQINASDLAASLRQEIESIPSLRDSLIDEETGRLQAILDVEATLAALGLDITQTFAAVTSLETTSIDGADVMAQQISAVAASNGQNLAAITEETLARVGADSAEASKREALAVKVGQDISGAITAEATITANNLGVVAEQVNTVQAYTERAVFRQTSAPTEAQGRRTNSLWFDTDDGNKLYQWTGSAWVSLQDKVAIDAFAAIQRIDTTISQFDYASAQSVEDLESSVEYVQDVSIPNLGSSIGDVSGNVSDLVGDVVHLRDTTMPTVISANIQDYNATAVGFCILNNGFGATSTSTAHNTKAKCEAAGGAWQPLSAISKAVKQLEINDGGSTLTIQDKMEAYKDEFDNLKGEYTMKFSGTEAEGVIGGFGLAVGGPEGSRSVDAAFDVDRFWIGTPGAIQKPFVVQNGTVYIGNAMINEAAISTARIADLAVDTLRIGNNAVSVTENFYNFGAHAIVYPSTSNTSSPRYTQYSTDGPLSNMLNGVGSNWSSGLNMPTASMNVGGVSGELYDITVLVQFEFGIQAKALSSRLIIFTPEILIQRTGFANSGIVLPRVACAAQDCYNNMKIIPYSASFATSVYANTSVIFGLDSTRTLLRVAAQDLGSTIAADGSVAKHCYMKRIDYSATLKKR